MAEFWGKGIELGLKGKQLTEFVESQTRLLAQREERQAQREREERQAQSEREERQAQREERQAQREERERQIELKRLELQIEMETKRLELQTEMVRVQNKHEAPRQRDNQQQMLHRAPKLPAFADGKDQIDCYLARFERFAESARWQRDEWAIQLSAHLTGAALEVYTRLSNDDARDYDVLKEALLRCYNFTERGYRQRFRECQPLSGETPSQFVERLSSYLQKWVELSGEEQSYESLRDLIVKEQFLNACPKDLATRLEEQKLRGLKDITDAAERYLIAHGRTLGTSKSSKPFQKSGNQGNQPAKGQTESAPTSNEGQNITCFHCNAKGHRVANCPQKKNNGHVNDKAQEHRRRYYDNKRQTSGSNQQVCASSVILPRAAEHVATPSDVEECISDGQLLLANGKSISVVASAAVSVSNMPVSKGFVEKQEVTVLRDSGCNGVIVKEDLVPTEKFTGDFKWTLMADSKCVKAPVVKIQIDTPYFTGEVEAVCLKKPLYDLLIGNIGGARRPDDPDVEWRMGAAQPAVEEEDPLPFTNEDISELLRDDRATVHRRDQPQVVSAVTTRPQAKKDKTTTPLRVTNSSATAVVDRNQLIQLQEADSTLTKYRSRPVKEMTKGEGTVHSEVKAKILYRVFQHARPPEAVQVAASVEEPAELDEFDGEELLELGDLHKKEGVDDVKLGPDLTEDQQKELHDFMGDFTHRFSDVPGSTSLVEHEVHLTSDVPVRSKPYPIPFQARESLKKDIDNMLKMGVIRESSSPYSSPVVVVKKKDGTNRVCIDFRKVNKITVFDPEPMPTAADLFRRLTGSKIFSKIDLSKGYWQIPVREEDIPKTAFATPDGTYECLRMPFGMVNSGATLKRGMRKMLKGMKNFVYYWDDLLVHTETFAEHLETLRELFSRLTKANLTVRPSKCILGTDNVDFIGHSLKEGQKGLLLENVTKILNAPRPETKKQVRSFLGLAGYYREFIPNFAAITAPLSDMTRKGCPNRILWGPAQEKAYQTVRDLISRDPVLRLPDTAKEFILRTDASDEGIGAMLMQEHGGKPFPVSYASKKLSGAEKNYSTMEKECLAIVWGIKKFELYLQGVKFVLQTDHKPLTYLNSAKFVNNRIMRWVMYLQNFDMRVESIKGSDNVGADFLSRVCE
ncbi:hypothetical protein V1264_019673 [Littorina saxatilis]|uniref:Reverse transcriptase n=1 Tax=Littorina saxatilis TaxID=31220 RepID=A0AAN9BGE3_9CAEN